MKSRTSSSNWAVFKKDLTRFAPVWIEYSIVLAIIAWFLHEEGSRYFESDGVIALFSMINLFYGFVCAMSVFGYLHDSIECNTVHAFPIRREAYFGLHLNAGFWMGFLPNVLFCLCLLPLGGDEIGSLFFGMTIQFTFFYALGIFCMFLTGRKFAALTLYGLFNFLAPLVQWAVTTLYLPKLPGIWIDETVFNWFYPMFQFMINQGPMEDCVGIFSAYGLAGLGLIFLAFLLYRSRKLEYAGDFLAVKGLTGVFLAAVSFTCGCILAAISQELFGEQPTPMLIFGLLVGWFTGLMLLHKTVRVFQPRRVVGAAAIVAVVLGSLWLVELDLPGRVYHIPAAEDVKRVHIGMNYSEWADSYETEDPEVIADILQLHEEILEQPNFLGGHSGYESCFLTYELANGRKLMRWYEVWDSEAYDHLQFYYSQPEYLLDVRSFEEFKAQVGECGLAVYTSRNEIHRNVTGEDLDKMMELFWQDCVAGHMSRGNIKNQYPQIDLGWEMKNKDYYIYVSVPSSTETYEFCMELYKKFSS